MRRILKRKKYSYIWAKYWLEDKQKPIERAKLKEKLAEYLAIALVSARAFTGMEMGVKAGSVYV